MLFRSENLDHHKEYYQKCLGLYELLSGHRPVEISATGEQFACDKDDPSEECQSAWNSFWEENYYPEEAKLDDC